MIYDESDPTAIIEYCVDIQVLNCQIMWKKNEMFKCEICAPGFRFIDYQCRPYNCAIPSDIPHR